MINQDSALLAVQNALLGSVSCKLRAVSVKVEFNHIQVTAYYDGLISKDDQQSMLLAETEFIALFPEDVTIEWNILRHDYPKVIPKVRSWAYLRKEP